MHLSLPEVVGLLAAALVVFYLAYRICTKAGFPGYLALASVIPVANMLLVLFLAFAEWPIHREIRRAQQIVD